MFLKALFVIKLHYSSTHSVQIKNKSTICNLQSCLALQATSMTKIPLKLEGKRLRGISESSVPPREADRKNTGITLCAHHMRY